MELDRRRFLQVAALGAAALALPGFGRAGTVDEAARFDAGLARYPWLVGWQDAPVLDGRAQTLAVEGRVPTGLVGTLYRNGPGRFSRAGRRYGHWFDGDGLMQAWRVDARGVSHRARFVDTPKFQREQAVGRFVRAAAGTRIEDAEAIRNSDDLNTANTAVIAHAGSLFALWEGGSATMLEPETLRSQGAKTWGTDLESVPFSAHPIVDRDGTLWNFGLSGEQLLIWQIGANGVLREVRTIKLPYPGYLHAFSMTDRHLAFVVLPYVLEGAPGDSSFFEALKWRPQRGCRALVVDKDLGRQRWFGLPAGAAYHYGPAMQRGDELILQACWGSDGESLRSPFASEMRGVPKRVASDSHLLQIALNLKRGGVRVQTVADRRIDFPDWDTRQPTGAMFALAGGDNEHGYFDAVCAIDPDRGETQRYHYGDGVMVEEHRFVAAPRARRPTQGWLLGTVLDYRRRRTGLSMLDAENLAAGPQAMAWLPNTLPLGFHGWFDRA
ncbi:MAG: carotenoid oxygenase family protein [Lysobacter sp.]